MRPRLDCRRGLGTLLAATVGGACSASPAPSEATPSTTVTAVTKVASAPTAGREHSEPAGADAASAEAQGAGSEFALGAGGTPQGQIPTRPLSMSDVSFSAKRGWYSGDQSVTLTSNRPGAQLLYGLNGQLPSEPYVGPLTLTDNGSLVTLRARTVIGGVLGPLHTHSYVFLPDRGSAVVVINNNDLTAPQDEDETPVTFEFIPSPQTGLSAVAEEAGTAPNTSGESAGKSDKVYFRRAYGNGTLDADLFGDFYHGVRPTVHHDHLFLRSDHRDFSFMRNLLAHDSLLALGQLGPHGRLVDYFENGKLQGTRYLLERPEGGFMESYTDIDKRQWIAVSGADAVGTSLDPDITTFSTWAEVDQTVNVRSLADFLMVQWQAGVKDYRPELKNWRATGPIGLGGGPPYRWHFFNWDIDRGYTQDHHHFGSPKGIWERIEQFPQARFIFQDRLQCAFFNEGPLTVPSLMRRFYTRFAEVQRTSLLTESGEDLTPRLPLVEAEIQAWLVARTELLFDTVFTADMVPEKTAVSVAVTDGLLTLSDPNDDGAIYYRLDGGDPRTLEGSLDAAALLYQGPVALPAGFKGVIARSYDETAEELFERWSPACDTPRTPPAPAQL